MAFHTYLFILGFLPLTVLVYFLACRFWPRACKPVLIGASLLFYAYSGWLSLGILLASVLGNYLFARCIRPNSSMTKNTGRACIALPIVLNITLLFYFKYLSFFVHAINSCLHTELALRSPLLPLGISFFTFQQIAFLVSHSRGLTGKLNLEDYLTYILYFPKLLMGPLMEPQDFLSQLNDPERKKPSYAALATGLQAFAFGLFQKLVLADSFASGVQWAFRNQSTATAMDWILAMLFYTLQIYFDFKGYTDMALGVSHMFNIDMPHNFLLPYRAASVQDFWKRWHKTLTGFFRSYVYIPLGGNRKGAARTYLHIFLIFLISGLWHGANWTFVLWGCLYGCFMILDRMLGSKLEALFPPVRWLATFLLVQVLWLLFRADSVQQWFQILKVIAGLQDLNVTTGMLQSLPLPEADLLSRLPILHKFSVHIRGLWVLVFTLFGLGLSILPREDRCKTLRPVTARSLPLAITAFVWSFLCLGRESVFVYFNF